MSDIHPDHYKLGQFDTMLVIRQELGDIGAAFFCRGNVIKYLSRASSPGRTPEQAASDRAKAETYVRYLTEPWAMGVLDAYDIMRTHGIRGTNG